MLARADEPAQQDDTSARISALQQQLDQLRVQQAQQQKLLEQKDIAQTQDRVSKDASRHDEMLDITGVSAGYTNGRFYLQSDDGNFVWRPWLHMQFRDVTLDRKDFKTNGDDEVDNGFEMRRMRFGFDGNLFTPDLTYFFNWATVRANGTSNVTGSTGTRVGTVSNNLGGAPLLEEAWVKYNFHDTPFYIKAGQIKDPVNHEQIVSSRYQESAERSLTADMFFNGDAFTEGVTFIYDPAQLRSRRRPASITASARPTPTSSIIPLRTPTTTAWSAGPSSRRGVAGRTTARWRPSASRSPT